MSFAPGGTCGFMLPAGSGHCVGQGFGCSAPEFAILLVIGMMFLELSIPLRKQWTNNQGISSISWLNIAAGAV